MIAKRNVTQQVVDYFIKKIEEKSWKKGEKIPSENTLTKELSVSRSSVRAAIQQFVGVGVMESIHGKGTFLKEDDLSVMRLGSHHDIHYDFVDMNKLLEFRLILETDSCYFATLNATAKNIERLKFYLDKMKESIGTPHKFVHYDMLFHEEIISATQNPLLESSFKNVINQKIDRLEEFNETFGYKDGIYYHTLLLKAIEAKDATRAKRIMRSHLQKAIDDVYYEKNVADEENEIF
ncbi:MAG: FadR family transcriptional regulator [Firmicutes bacterium HGW-Firmicutes-2]|jgi:GntR family transcriptional repressor for pyruvate dehydrogenase complex|nr:MAG: FadR family transcriptional regulator [Firmicutes bacterium HGW-Firmicutes-2]